MNSPFVVDHCKKKNTHRLDASNSRASDDRACFKNDKGLAKEWIKLWHESQCLANFVPLYHGQKCCKMCMAPIVIIINIKEVDKIVNTPELLHIQMVHMQSKPGGRECDLLSIHYTSDRQAKMQI